VSARIRFTPVMNVQDFQTGMAKLAQIERVASGG
jgi:hypothetical protein